MMAGAPQRAGLTIKSNEGLVKSQPTRSFQSLQAKPIVRSTVQMSAFEPSKVSNHVLSSREIWNPNPSLAMGGLQKDLHTAVGHKANYKFSVQGSAANQIQDNYQDKSFAVSQGVSSYRPYPSILMSARNNVFRSVASRVDQIHSQRSRVVMNAVLDNVDTETDSSEVPEIPVTKVEEAPKKKKRNLQQMLIARTLKENVREDRDTFEVPKLEPFGDEKFWDFKIFPRAYKNWEQMNKKDQIVATLIGSIHGMALFAPFFYTPAAFWWFFGGYMLTCQGITMSYHRQLTHKSFTSPKWFEYTMAFVGVLAVQGDPIEWCSAHRHHHAQCDKETDPHSPYDGFFWSHMGWMFDSKATQLLFETSNVKDLKDQAYYNWLKKHYLKITIAQPIVFFLLGGLPAMFWGFAARTVFAWHITWAVNSVSHMYGRQMFKTNDLSMNNPIIGILAQGEGWHNNHHAFQDSCRHGLKWWQIDMTWYYILILEKLGIAQKLRYPDPKKMEAMAWD